MADSQWVLDIAAEMPEGAATIAELDALTERLTGAARRSDDFQAALKRVTADLDAAKAASAEAAASLAQGNEQYKLLEREAIRAGKALEQAQARNRFDPRAARSAHEAQAALDEYTGTLRGLEGASAAAQAKQAGLARTLTNLSQLGAHADARQASLSNRFEKLGAIVGRVPGPLGQVGSRLLGTAKAGHEVRLALGAANVATLVTVGGFVLATAAVVALTVAVVAGAVALTRFAVAQADAARNAALSRQAFAALHDEAAAGVAAFDSVSAATGLADKDLVSLTKQLKAAEVSAADMPEALRTAALAERALGSGGASEFISRIREGELAVGEFAREAEDKFGGIVVEQLRSLDAQLERAKKSWSKIFAGVRLDPFLDALGVLVGMFDKANPLAEALGLAVEGALNPVGPLALKAAYAVEAFALGVAIQLTKMYLAVKPAIRWFSDFFGLASDGAGMLDVVTKIGEVAAVVAVVVGAGLAGAVAVVGAVFAAAAGVVGLFGAAIYGAVNSVWTLVSGLFTVGAAVVEWARTVGVDLMLGLVEGVTSMVTSVVSAVSEAVGSAIAAAKDVLGIASPSKVFAEIGTQTADGYVQGVESGTPEAQGSMAAMVGSDAVASGGPVPAGAATAGAGESAGRSFNFAGATFNFNGVANAERARDMFSEMLTRLLEDDADSLGGAEVPA